MNIFREPFFNYLIEKGIPMRIEDGMVHLPGFYKHDNVKLYIEDDEIYIVDRYGLVYQIGFVTQTNEHNFVCLVQFNHRMWLNYKDREPFKSPNSIWLPFMIEFKLVKERVTYE